MTNSIAKPRSKRLIGARPSCAPREQLRKTPGENFAQYDNAAAVTTKYLALPTAQNPDTDCKIRLVLEHTVCGRAVFYCVPRDAPGAKSPNFGIKNRVALNASKPRKPVFIDIEPSAKVPYINPLAEHSRL